MKKLIPIAIVTLALLLNGCGLKEVIGPNVDVTTNSDSYQPVTKNSTWKYNIQVAGTTVVDQATITMTGETRTTNSVVFFKAVENTSTDSSVGYFAHNGASYLSHSDDDGYDVPYLDDVKAVGDTFKLSIVDPNAGAGVQAQYVLTILEKGATKTINGKIFKNIIHTRSELQYNSGSGYQTVDMSEYYVAKGIGLVEIDGYLGNVVIVKQTITSYTIN
jgi:hypothetical protein